MTNWLIVISSKSDKFFERHLPGRLFVPSPPIRYLLSRLLRDFLLKPSLSRDNFPIRPYLLKSLDLCGVWDVSASVAWMYYKAKGYKKSLMPWGFHSTRLRLSAMLVWLSERLTVTLN